MSFPSSLDTFTTPNSSQTMNDPAATQSTIVGALNTAVTAIEAKVGIDSSAVTTSIDYKTTRLTAKWDIQTHDWTNYIKKAVGTDGYMLVADSTQATGLNYIAPTSGGTVTSASVVSANWFTGTVATATTTPAITLTTSITGLLKGNWTAISAASAWTDYVTPTWVTTMTNKTLTSPVITWGTATSQTITTPTINVGSDNNWDILIRAAWTTARLAVGTTWDFVTVLAWAPVYDNPFQYEWTYTIATATSSGGWVNASTHYQTTDMTIWVAVLTRGTSGYSKLLYSPDNATWTTIENVSTAWTNTFTFFMKKWYWYYVEVDSPVGGVASTGTLTFRL